MSIIKSLCYILSIVTIVSIFIITPNISNIVYNNGTEAKAVDQLSVQDNRALLIVTGRKELNGFKGYRHYRHGYRKYSDGWWYPEKAFVVYTYSDVKDTPLNAISTQKYNPTVFSSLEKKELWSVKGHIDYCKARYLSYNQNDNSYQPFHGPRKQCFSSFFKE
ncbi:MULTISPECIES: BA14K family protein [unclassified Bartonella]|uniref:BA14K family protein n=1 Tax=unclassified Bartonella TaxID=2645622 RepID=UPI00099A4614|nr:MULTISPECIES: BA14K family protein [unclassified Bartonella]AQX28573.1 BA14K-like protein [Bartonella sp. JB15]AQX29833.1 BA14K-like protein [Bartonella sp. JB63]